MGRCFTLHLLPLLDRLFLPLAANRCWVLGTRQPSSSFLLSSSSLSFFFFPPLLPYFSPSRSALSYLPSVPSAFVRRRSFPVEIIYTRSPNTFTEGRAIERPSNKRLSWIRCQARTERESNVYPLVEKIQENRTIF